MLTSFVRGWSQYQDLLTKPRILSILKTVVQKWSLQRATRLQHILNVIRKKNRERERETERDVQGDSQPMSRAISFLERDLAKATTDKVAPATFCGNHFGSPPVLAGTYL